MKSRLLGILLWIISPYAMTGQALDRLNHFFSDVKTLNARFDQQVFSEQGEQLQSSTGTMMLAKPGKFRWEYKTPDSQLILADGTHLWIYDPELEQATKKPMGEALGSAPVMLLTEFRQLDKDFEVSDAGAKEGIEWVELTPKIADTEFTRIELGLGETGIQRMRMHDQFGQLTVVEFKDLQINKPIQEDQFQFDVPPNVDVIGDLM